MKSPLRLILAVLMLTGPAALAADKHAREAGITREQADAILNELKELHKQIDKLIELQGAKAGPAGPLVVTLKLPLGSPMLGRSEAPYTVVEFLDLQCPFCKRFEESTFAALRKDLIDTGIVRYYSVDFPLEMHANAKPAAVAARCAGEQGKFWELRDALLRNAANLSAEAILGYAKATGVKAAEFATCLASKRYEAQIDAGQQAAMSKGVEGTPSFVVGKSAPGGVEGTLIVGAVPFGAFEEAIKRLESK